MIVPLRKGRNMQNTVASLVKDMRFEGVLLVKSADQKISNGNGKKYLDVTLGDRTGEMNGKMWDQNALPPAAGTPVSVSALVQEYNGRLQLRVERMVPVPEGQADMSLLVRTAPEDAGSMYREILETAEGMRWQEIRALTLAMLRRAGEKLKWYPAAQRVHHAERSGLLHHTVTMLRAAKALEEVYPDLNRDLLNAGVIVHDLGKIREMTADESGAVGDYSDNGLLLGHLVEGVAMIRECAREEGIEGESVLLLCHMMISHHGQAEFGSPKPPMFPEAEALHMIDDLDAKMNAMFNARERTPVGVFSEKIWALDRRLYHPRYPGDDSGASVTADGKGPALKTTGQDPDGPASMEALERLRAAFGGGQ